MNAKYLQFAFLLLLCVGLDQWTKQVASARLATTHSWIDHPIVVEVSADHDGQTVHDVLGAEFTRNDDAHVREIGRRYARTPDGGRLTPESVVSAGDAIHVTDRKVVVIPGYFDFEYTRNPGAAFGFLADGESPLRVPFFIVVSLIAIGVILVMLRGVSRTDQLAIFALSFIAGGAIGNFIDRVAYGWVIDFIVWKYSETARWPTFNIADAFISVGVALLVVQMGRDWQRERKEAAQLLALEE